MAEIEIVPTRHGRMFVPAKDIVIGRSLRIYGEWAQHEIDELSRLLLDGDGAIIDVGAHLGVLSIAYARRFPGSAVLALEPQPFMHQLLVLNTTAGRLPNVRALNLGCSDRLRVVDVPSDYDALDWNTGAVSLADSGAEPSASRSTPALLVPLDRLAPEGRVQFIKIDVEGMEAQVLAGAARTIFASRPIIFFEALTMDSVKPSLAILRAAGYELRWMETNAFNPDNYNQVQENIWGHGETGVLAMPSPGDQRVAHLPLVTGKEAVVPQKRFVQSTAPG